jgi:UPF0755 protein
VLYGVLTMLLAYPLWIHPASRLTSPSPDTDLTMWALAWDTHAFTHQPLAIFDANIYYPQHLTLAYSENFIGSALLAAPALWLTGNPVLAFNLVALVSPVLCGVGAFLLARRLRVSVSGATLAGIVFAFSPPRFLRIDQLHLAPIQWIPFCLAYLVRYLDDGRPRDLRIAAVFFSVQALTSGHGAVFLAIAAILLAAGALAAEAYRYFHRDTPPPVVYKTITVTIPEGYSRAQTAQLAKEAGLKGSYPKASVRSRYLDPARYGGKDAGDLEGFLFPDTFELRPQAPVRDLVQLQLEDFKRRIKGVEMRYARSKNLTTYDVVTIASMVEREAQLEGQRKLVAAVIYNRLHEGMPLGIDATTRFATGNYTRPLTESELATPSPYNTRTNAGLPPGPIDSPGLASIEAAAHPAKVDYLYYVVEPGACGKLAFSSTAVQFERDVARYNAARAAAGGNSPTTCGR